MRETSCGQRAGLLQHRGWEGSAHIVTQSLDGIPGQRRGKLRMRRRARRNVVAQLFDSFVLERLQQEDVLD